MLGFKMVEKIEERIPEEVINDLPSDARMVFKNTFKRAYLGFKNVENIKGMVDEKTRYQNAIDVAWFSVKRKFEKKNNRWVRK